MHSNEKFRVELFGPYVPATNRRTRPLRAVFVGLTLGLALALWRLN